MASSVGWWVTGTRARSARAAPRATRPARRQGVRDDNRSVGGLNHGTQNSTPRGRGSFHRLESWGDNAGTISNSYATGNVSGKGTEGRAGWWARTRRDRQRQQRHREQPVQRGRGNGAALWRPQVGKQRAGHGAARATRRASVSGSGYVGGLIGRGTGGASARAGASNVDRRPGATSGGWWRSEEGDKVVGTPLMDGLRWSATVTPRAT